MIPDAMSRRREEDPIIILGDQLSEAVALLEEYVRLRNDDALTPLRNSFDDAVDEFLKEHDV